MSKTYLWSLLAMAVALLTSISLASCGDDEDTAPELNVSPSSLSLEGDGDDSNYFDIESNTAWIIDVDKDWINLSTLSGSGNASIEVTADENPDMQKRTANISVTAGNITRRIRVTQEAGLNLNVSPSTLTLDGQSGQSGTFTVNTSKSWTITGQPSWLQLSGTSGTGNTTVSVTTLEDNRSENPRTATLTITAGSKTVTIAVSQSGIYPNDVYVEVVEDYGLSNGHDFELTFGSGTQGYVFNIVSSSYYDSYTNEESIYNDLINSSNLQTVPTSKEDYWPINGLNANTEYVFLAIGYKLKGSEKQWGKMTIKRIKTKPSATNFDVHISTITYNSTQWNFIFSKDSRCHHFYVVNIDNEYAEILSNYSDIACARLIKTMIKENENYTYLLNDGQYAYPRTTSDYALFVCGWGVSDTNEFSNNLSRQYRNLSSNAPEYVRIPQKSNNNIEEAKALKKNWNDVCKHVHTTRL